MSLLMEALKKAEQAKRTAGEETQPTPEPSPASPTVHTPEPGHGHTLPGELASPHLGIARNAGLATATDGQAGNHDAVAPPPALAPTPAEPRDATRAARTLFLAREDHARLRNRRVAAYGVLSLLLGAGVCAHLYSLYQSTAATVGVYPGGFLPLPPEPAGASPGERIPRKLPFAAEAPVATVTASPPRHPQRETPPANPFPRELPAAAPAVPPAPPAIAIARRAKAPAPAPLLARAYEAFRRGDTAHAQGAYEQVLQRDPGNRNALLGLAAVAVRNQEAAAARRFYQRLLDHEPADPLARIGLMALEGPVDPVAYESELRLMLAAAPDEAALHFALGNLYAAAQRWGDAQQSYYAAVEADSRRAHPAAQNPDYAFNLAVALEHLGKHRAAADSYRRALALAERDMPGFDPMLARGRIAALEPTQEPLP